MEKQDKPTFFKNRISFIGTQNTFEKFIQDLPTCVLVERYDSNRSAVASLEGGLKPDLIFVEGGEGRSAIGLSHHLNQIKVLDNYRGKTQDLTLENFQAVKLGLVRYLNS